MYQHWDEIKFMKDTGKIYNRPEAAGEMVCCGIMQLGTLEYKANLL
jgi:hypothetical protein